MKDIYYAVAHRDQEEIDSFKTRYQNFDTKLIPSIFKDVLGYTVTDWKQSTSWGTSHVIYYVNLKQLDRPLILRANLGFNEEPEYVMAIEKMLTDQVSKIGIPVNKVLHADLTREKYPFDFQIQEVLKGQDLENNFKGTKEIYDKISFELGQLIAKYQTFTFENFGRFDHKAVLNNKLKGTKKSFYDYITVSLIEDIKYLVDAEVLTISKSKRVLSLFEEYKPVINIPKGSLVHHDLADHNIMFENEKITGIFDWEACVVGDPVLDLASCPTWRTHYPREEKLIEGYTSIQSLPDNFEEKMNIYRLRTMLWKMVFAIRADILNEKRKQRFLDSLAPFKLSL